MYDTYSGSDLSKGNRRRLIAPGLANPRRGRSSDTHHKIGIFTLLHTDGSPGLERISTSHFHGPTALWTDSGLRTGLAINHSLASRRQNHVCLGRGWVPCLLPEASRGTSIIVQIPVGLPESNGSPRSHRGNRRPVRTGRHPPCNQHQRGETARTEIRAGGVLVLVDLVTLSIRISIDITNSVFEHPATDSKEGRREGGRDQEPATSVRASRAITLINAQ